MAMRARKALNDGVSPAPTPAPAAAPSKPRSYVAPSRTGRAQVVCFVDRRTKRQLDTMAFEQERSLQSLTLEALDLLFQAHKLPRIAVEGSAEAMQGEK
jgi:hypothetical protein